MKNEKQIAAAAAEFAERWKGRGYERGESQPFWIDLLSNVFGIETPSDGFITFEDHRMVDASNFIDGRIRSTKVLIEQKSLGKDLRAGIRQSDGSLLNPFQQARRNRWERICVLASVKVTAHCLIRSNRLAVMWYRCLYLSILVGL